MGPIATDWALLISAIDDLFPVAGYNSSTSADYDALVRAARTYGLRPTTLARLLVNRGVRAVLESGAES